jgi:hypothetical protein
MTHPQRARNLTIEPASDGRRDVTVAWWAPGAVEHAAGPVLVSVTDFELDRAVDVARAAVEGVRLRRAWSSVPGSFGLWVWAKPGRKRVGSVSIWRQEEDLRRFVRWPRHVEIMRRYRDAGEVTDATWSAERPDPAEIWARSLPRLAGDDPELSHSPVTA